MRTVNWCVYGVALLVLVFATDLCVADFQASIAVNVVLAVPLTVGKCYLDRRFA